jgi:Protein of unknown function (DUF1348)
MNQTTEQAQILEPKIKVDIMTRPPLPPFTLETSIQKVRLAEDGWNSRDPEKVALAYTIDSRWRNRAEFANGRQEIIGCNLRALLLALQDFAVKWIRVMPPRYQELETGEAGVITEIESGRQNSSRNLLVL